MVKEDLKEYLQKIASKRSWMDKMLEKNLIIDDFAGGNIDDAYYGGVDDGEIGLAREILEKFYGN